MDPVTRHAIGGMPLHELHAKAAPGWPRWFFLVTVGGRPRRMPLPWINGLHPVWAGVRGFVKMEPGRVDEAKSAGRFGLCVVCGEELGHVRVMGRWRGDKELERVTMLTDGPPGHPRCIALAVKHCPHLRALAGEPEGDRKGPEPDRVVAYVYDGPGPAAMEVPGTNAGIPRVVHPRARPLTPEELRALVSRDPLGVAPSLRAPGVSSDLSPLLKT